MVATVDPGRDHLGQLARSRNRARLVKSNHLEFVQVPGLPLTDSGVYDVLEYLAGGMTSDQIVRDFPQLTDAHVRAAPSCADRHRR